MATLTIQINDIDDAIHSEVRNVLDKIGLTMSSVFRIYLQQIAKSRDVPFRSADDDPPMYYTDASGDLVPTPYLDAIITEVKEDIRLNRNLSPPIGRNELKAYLKGLRK